jgi:hypothetical protein
MVAALAKKDHRIGDEQDCFVPQVLKLATLIETDRVAKPEIRTRWIDTELDISPLSRSQFFAQHIATDHIFSIAANQET